MAGNTKVQKRSSSTGTSASLGPPPANSPSFSILSLFKPVRRSSLLSLLSNRRAEDPREDFIRTRKVRPSDYDNGLYVAEPGIDRKASAFIAKFHESQAIATA